MVLCIPCSSGSAVANVRSEELSMVVRRESDVLDVDGRGSIARPTSEEYIGETANEFFQALENIAEYIPIPGVAVAVKIATKLIRACDENRATLRFAEELKNRVKTLVTILVGELQDKKAEEIHEKLKEDIHALER
ncbi:hypothetical protein H0H81_009068 [Sphagnurus paluster]|uniref:Uncharacterized protein n=1 Tax=Sphagnurus paluster TaxID=117069 RepID=A0A9P7GW45_9AGAR|nr:hypothetical protein H0H81_009068 [Sphagnurus paluster]